MRRALLAWAYRRALASYSRAIRAELDAHHAYRQARGWYETAEAERVVDRRVRRTNRRRDLEQWLMRRHGSSG